MKSSRLTVCLESCKQECALNAGLPINGTLNFLCGYLRTEMASENKGKVVRVYERRAKKEPVVAEEPSSDDELLSSFLRRVKVEAPAPEELVEDVPAPEELSEEGDLQISLDGKSFRKMGSPERRAARTRFFRGREAKNKARKQIWVQAEDADVEGEDDED